MLRIVGPVDLHGAVGDVVRFEHRRPLTAEVASSPLQKGASMANDEHVALLKQGVAAWNAWRAENRNIRPNLSGAHLSEENLRGADLSTAILRGAVLRAAKLGKANLRLAN